MKKPAKFIQIAYQMEQETSTDCLYALDADGKVWVFSNDNQKWLAVPMERK